MKPIIQYRFWNADQFHISNFWIKHRIILYSGNLISKVMFVAIRIIKVASNSNWNSTSGEKRICKITLLFLMLKASKFLNIGCLLHHCVTFLGESSNTFNQLIQWTTNSTMSLYPINPPWTNFKVGHSQQINHK